MTNKQSEKKLLDHLVDLDKKISKLPRLSPEEETIIEADNNFESVYFSNKLEGNKLTEKEARDAIFSTNLKK